MASFPIETAALFGVGILAGSLTLFIFAYVSGRYGTRTFLRQAYQRTVRTIASLPVPRAHTRLLLLKFGCAGGLIAISVVGSVAFYDVASYDASVLIFRVCPRFESSLAPPRIPSHAMVPFPLLMNRCGLSTNEILAGAYKSKRAHSSIWALTLLATALAFSGLAANAARERRPVPEITGYWLVAGSIGLATVAALVLAIETREYALSPWLGRAADQLRSAATLAIATWHPVQQFLVFGVSPVGLALAFLSRALKLRDRVAWDRVQRVSMILVAVLLLAGPATALAPAAPLRWAFALGLGAAPLLLGLVALFDYRTSTSGNL